MPTRKISVYGRKVYVFVAAPYIGDPTAAIQAMNVRRCIEVCNELAELGFVPFCSLLFHFWDMMFPQSRKFWLDLNKQWLAKCDTLLRLPGTSAGAADEVALAMDLDMPVFYDKATLIGAYRQYINI